MATATKSDSQTTGCEEWLMLRVGSMPRTSLGWFRCGVGFYNKKEYTKAIECFEKSVALDPMNVNRLLKQTGPTSKTHAHTHI
jgi:tetratricopeptide (TPR) repeat protein